MTFRLRMKGVGEEKKFEVTLRSRDDFGVILEILHRADEKSLLKRLKHVAAEIVESGSAACESNPQISAITLGRGYFTEALA